MLTRVPCAYIFILSVVFSLLGYKLQESWALCLFPAVSSVPVTASGTEQIFKAYLVKKWIRWSSSLLLYLWGWDPLGCMIFFKDCSLIRRKRETPPFQRIYYDNWTAYVPSSGFKPPRQTCAAADVAVAIVPRGLAGFWNHMSGRTGLGSPSDKASYTLREFVVGIILPV